MYFLPGISSIRTHTWSRPSPSPLNVTFPAISVTSCLSVLIVDVGMVDCGAGLMRKFTLVWESRESGSLMPIESLSFFGSEVSCNELEIRIHNCLKAGILTLEVPGTSFTALHCTALWINDMLDELTYRGSHRAPQDGYRGDNSP